MILSNIFRRATKDYKFELTSATGNVALVNVAGYSKATIICSASGVLRPNGYIDNDKQSPTIQPIVTDLNGKISRSENRQNFIVDVSGLSWMYIYIGDSYTGNIFISLSQEKIKIDNSGITSLSTQYINVTSGTNVYYTDWVAATQYYRFIAVEVLRRDIADTSITLSVNGAYQVTKEQGEGAAYTWRDEPIIVMENTVRGHSGWLENYSWANYFQILVDGDTYDGAVIEVNVIGIA